MATTVIQSADWVNRELYPFSVREFRAPAGTMRYVDEGLGDPIVMIHGNPTWSFLYRSLIAGLKSGHRCIAPDLLGFGQSDRPADWPYRPQDHAETLTRLLDSLGAEAITLVVHDWGGPIGLSFALAHPERVRRIVLLNTFMWPLNRSRSAHAFVRLMGSPVGRALIRDTDVVLRLDLQLGFKGKAALTEAIYSQYRSALPKGISRKGVWVFPAQLTAAMPWLESLWAERERLAGKPALIAWGMKDRALSEKALQRWLTLFPDAQVTRFEDAGHFVQEAEGDAIASLIRQFCATS